MSIVVVEKVGIHWIQNNVTIAFHHLSFSGDEQKENLVFFCSSFTNKNIFCPFYAHCSWGDVNQLWRFLKPVDQLTQQHQHASGSTTTFLFTIFFSHFPLKHDGCQHYQPTTCGFYSGHQPLPNVLMSQLPAFWLYARFWKHISIFYESFKYLDYRTGY